MGPPADDVARWFLTAASGATPHRHRRRPRRRRESPGPRATRCVPWSTAPSTSPACSRRWRTLGDGDLVLFTDWRGDGDERLGGDRARELGHGARRAWPGGASTCGASCGGRTRPGAPQRAGGDPPRRGGQRGGRRGPARRAGAAGRVAPPEAGAGAPPRATRPTTSPSSAASTCATAAATTSATSATRRRSTSDDRYGDRPPWHDIQLEIRGPAVGDLALTFRERWDDPTPLDHRNPWRARIARVAREPRRPEPLPPRAGRSRPRPAPTPSRCCARTRPSARRTRSPPRASAASPGPTSRRSGGPGGSSTSRTSTCGRRR